MFLSVSDFPFLSCYYVLDKRMGEMLAHEGSGGGDNAFLQRDYLQKVAQYSDTRPRDVGSFISHDLHDVQHASCSG